MVNPQQSQLLKISEKQSSKQAHSDLELLSTKGFAGFSDSNGLRSFNGEFLNKLISSLPYEGFDRFPAIIIPVPITMQKDASTIKGIRCKLAQVSQIGIKIGGFGSASRVSFHHKTYHLAGSYISLAAVVSVKPSRVCRVLSGVQLQADYSDASQASGHRLSVCERLSS